MNGSRGIGVVALLAMLAGGLLVGCSTPPEYATSPELGAANVHEDILAKADLKYYWQRRIPLPPDDRLKDIYLLGENLYFLTTKNVMVCVDARVGNPRWSIQITKGGDEVFAPTHVDGMRLSKKRGGLDSVLNPPSLDSYPAFDAVLINTMTRLLVLDRKTGEVYRDMAFDHFSARNRGVSDGQRFYVGASNRMIYAVKLMAGPEHLVAGNRRRDRQGPGGPGGTTRLRRHDGRAAPVDGRR